MRYLTILFLLLFSFIATTFAQTLKTCPSIADLKNKDFKNWLPLYIEQEELASQTDQLQFLKEVTDFEAAKWSWYYLESAHCFYKGGDMTQHIILAQDAWGPAEGVFWQWLTPQRLAACRAPSPEACPFIE